jgi:predicted nucleotidyltransferase
MDTLFIAAGFFGYSKEIKAGLEQRGRSVLWFEDRPDTDALTKGMLRIAPSLMKGRVNSYVDEIIAQARQHDIRDVLVIKGEALSPAALGKLRKALPRARFVLYYWDSFLNMPADSPQKVDFFDRAFTFDPVNAAADSRLTHRPLFYLNEYAQLPASGSDIDVLFLGTAHSDRYAVLKRLKRALPPELRFEKVLYLPSRWVWRTRRVFDPSLWRASRDEFTFTPLSKSQVMATIQRARIVVDIERPIQSGLTIRTIEMLGASRKLITTNPRIAEADFYHPDNQVGVDRYKPRLNDRFLESPWRPVARDLMQRYSLNGWLDEVFGV